MKIKRLFTVILCGIILFSLAACNQKNEDYKSKLISVINKQETATVQDIFSFKFDRAYVFNFTDGYMDGEEFAQKYNLDISITQVEAGQADYIQRIVFVDKNALKVNVVKTSSKKQDRYYKEIFTFIDEYMKKIASGYCPNCEQAITGAGKFCSNCGEKLIWYMVIIDLRGIYDGKW